MAFINVQTVLRITCYLKPIAMVYLEHIIFDQDWFYHKSLKTISKQKGNGFGYDNPSVSFVGERELGSLSQSGGFGLASYS